MEILPIVDMDGRVVGQASREVCHGGSFALHPVVHLHVWGSDGRLLLQRRSMSKRIQPGRWDTAVGGHVAYGEEIMDALIRETTEELGFVPDVARVRRLGRYAFRSSVECELVYVYGMVYDGPFDFQREEIDEVRFFRSEEVDAMVGGGVLTPNFEQERERVLRGVSWVEGGGGEG